MCTTELNMIITNSQNDLKSVKKQMCIRDSIWTDQPYAKTRHHISLTYLTGR